VFDLIRLTSLLLVSILLSGCVAEATITTPKNVRHDLHKEAIELMTIIDERMKNVEELTKEEEQKFYRFNEVFSPNNIEESRIVNSLNSIHVYYIVNLSAYKNNSQEGKENSMKYYIEDLTKLKAALNLK
jgi:hypothetical protein